VLTQGDFNNLLDKHQWKGASPFAAPYYIVPFNEAKNFTVTFNTGREEWRCTADDRRFICFVNRFPENIDDLLLSTYVLCDDAREGFAHFVSTQDQRYNCHYLAHAWSCLIPRAVVPASAAIHPSSIIYPGTIIGENVQIGANCSVGHAGFGFARSAENADRLPHTGGVVIKSDCVIGSNCTIAAGTFNPTTINEKTWIDDQVHIAHNCQVGSRNTITAGAILAGSVKLGDDVWIGPNTTILNGVSLGNGVFVGIGSSVTKSFDGGRLAGNPARALRSL